MNVYDSPQYQACRAKYAFLFQKTYRAGHLGEDAAQEFCSGYTVHTLRYEEKEPGRCWYHAARHRLADASGKTVYTWDNINDSGDFFALFPHANGNHYLVFREDLYGYSVLEVETGNSLHYMPEESFPLGKERAQETFIWAGAVYDPQSGLLAVSGCYWACPNDTLLLDFSDPLAEQDCGGWLELHAIVDPDYERYDDIDLLGFGPDGLLSFRAFSAVDGSRMAFTLPVKQVLERMKKERLSDTE